jgi:hypothetical protein
MLALVIAGESLVMTFITLGVFALIFWLLWWVLEKFKPREPFYTVLNAILIIGAVIICINALLSLIGKGFITF